MLEVSEPVVGSERKLTLSLETGYIPLLEP